MNPVHLVFTIIFLIWLPITTVRAAQARCVDEASCVPVGQLELGVSLGLGTRSNPVENGDEIPLLVIPSLSYYGERFFINNLDAGYTLHDGSDYQLNVLLTPGYDSMFFDVKDPRNIFFDANTLAPDGIEADGTNSNGEDTSQISPGKASAGATEVQAPEAEYLPSLENRDIAILGGIEYSRWSGSDTWQLQLLQDISKVHNGYELRSAWRREYNDGSQLWIVALGGAWKSTDLNDYYYGVSKDEAGTGRSQYDADGGFNVFGRLGWRKPLGEKWQLRADVQYDQLSGAISDSPLVKNSYSVAVFVGLKYRIR